MLIYTCGWNEITSDLWLFIKIFNYGMEILISAEFCPSVHKFW